MSSYSSADSPKGAHEVEQYKRNKDDTSNAIKEFHLLTKSMQQKMTLFKTPQDSRVNHQQLKELTEKGNRLVAKINRRLQDLSRACQGSLGRSRKAEVNKLSNDFKNQLKAFEATCQQLIENEKLAVAEIRKSSRSFRSDDDKPAGLGNYNEDQIYTQAHVQSYNEDDLMRREEDIIQINHQMREVNAAFREVDDMIAAQGEVVLDVEEETNQAKDHTEAALENARQADMRRGFCQCSKTKLMCWGFLVLIAVVVVLTLVLSLK